MDKPMQKLKFILIALALGAIVFWISQNSSRIAPILETVFNWVGQQGMMAPVYYVAAFTLACFLFAPMILLSLIGGFLFGVVPGAILVAIASVVTSSVAYFLSHFFLRAWVKREIEKSILLQVIDNVVQNSGWKMVLLTRLTPIFPFIPLNYAYGVSKIKFIPFVIASFIGFLPGAFLNAYFGSMAGSLIGIETRTHHVPGESHLLGISAFVALLATIYMARLTGKVFAVHNEACKRKEFEEKTKS